MQRRYNLSESLARGELATYISEDHRIPAANGREAETSPLDHPSQGAYVSSDQLATHLQVDRYGSFLLTEAIRPSLDLQVVPRQAYRLDVYSDSVAGLRVPVLAAAVSRENLFDTFPDKNIPANFNFGIFTYPRNAPFGFNGRYVYVRSSYVF